MMNDEEKPNLLDLRKRLIFKSFVFFILSHFFSRKGFCYEHESVVYLGKKPLRSVLFSKKRIISIKDFGAYGDGIHDDTIAFQNACIFVYNNGGGRVFLPTPSVEYILSYPVFLFDNTELFGTGEHCNIVFLNPCYDRGRGGFVIGSSLEANREKALANYGNNNYNNSTINKKFVNPGISKYLKDNPEFVQSKNSSIHDIHIVARFTESDRWGGYGINFVNAWNCHTYNIWGEGWTQLIGMGSDVSPETPSNYMCTAKNLHILSPDYNRTYYAIGFIANSTHCSIEHAKLYKPMTTGSKNGSAVATNACENCVITDVDIPDLGRTESSEGILLNNSKDCYVNNINIGNAISAISTYYTIPEYNDANSPNILGPFIVASNCDVVFSISAKYALIKGFVNKDSKVDVYFKNINATGNIIDVTLKSIKFGKRGADFYLDKNKILGIKKDKMKFSSFSLNGSMKNVSLFSTLAPLIGGSLDNSLVFELPQSVFYYDSVIISWALKSEMKNIKRVFIVKIDSLSRYEILELLPYDENFAQSGNNSDMFKVNGKAQSNISVNDHSKSVLLIILNDENNHKFIDNITVDFYSYT